MKINVRVTTLCVNPNIIFFIVIIVIFHPFFSLCDGAECCVFLFRFHHLPIRACAVDSDPRLHTNDMKQRKTTVRLKGKKQHKEALTLVAGAGAKAEAEATRERVATAANFIVLGVF